MDGNGEIIKKTGAGSVLDKKGWILLLCSMAVGVIFDVLFNEKLPGISYPVFVIAFYAMFFYNLRSTIKPEASLGWFLTIPILALSITYTLFSNEVFMILNFLCIPVLVIIQTTLITGNNQYSWFNARFISDITVSMFARTLINVLKPFIAVFSFISTKTDKGKYAPVKKVLLGLVLSAPLVLIVILLLSSADAVFGHYVGNIPDILENIHLDEFLSHAVVILIGGIALFSYTFSLLTKDLAREGRVSEDPAASVRIFDPVIVVTMLVMVNIIYLFFVLIQFTYLFGSVNYALPEGITHAEYARRGFFELVAVTLINLGILLVNINLTKQSGLALRKTIRILNSLLIGCTFVMLLSAHFRMSLYEETYGYTYLRIFTHAFMAFILILLAAALYKVWKDGFRLLRAYIIISIVAFVAVNYMNVDVIVARNNIDRYHKTHNIDVQYLAGLSYDAVPLLVELLDDKDKNVAAQIENCLYEKKKELSRKRPWQSFNISSYRAKKLLTGYKLQYSKEAEVNEGQTFVP